MPSLLSSSVRRSAGNRGFLLCSSNDIIPSACCPASCLPAVQLRDGVDACSCNLFRCTTLTSHIGPFKKRISARASLLLLNVSNNSVFSTSVFSSEAAKHALRAGFLSRVFSHPGRGRAPSLMARHRNPLPVSFCLRRPKLSLSWRRTLRSLSSPAVGASALRRPPSPTQG